MTDFDFAEMLETHKKVASENGKLRLLSKLIDWLSQYPTETVNKDDLYWFIQKNLTEDE